jgi:hypothetical protein
MSVTAYVPRDAIRFARPVQVETPVGLTGVDTTGGKGVLCWRLGDSIRFAVRPSFRDFAEDDVVEDADIGTVVSYPGTFEHVRPTISRCGSELLVVTSRLEGSTAQTEVRVANDPETPTAWSLRGIIQTRGGLPTVASASATSTGRIRRLNSGRLVYQGGLWDGFLGVNFQHSGVWYSDNAGATWTNVVDEGYGSVGGSNLDVHSGAIGFDPVSGLLYWSGGNPGIDSGIVETSPDGVTWTKEITFSGTPIIFPIEDDGVRAFFGDDQGNIRRVADLGVYNFAYAGLPTTGARWLPPGEGLSISGSVQSSTRFLVTLEGVTFAFYNEDRVAVFPERGWQIGSVAL